MFQREFRSLSRKRERVGVRGKKLMSYSASSLSDLSGCSEKVADRGQISTIFLAIAGTIG